MSKRSSDESLICVGMLRSCKTADSVVGYFPEGMHCYAHLYKKALPEPERGAKSALDLASAWISSARRHPLVFDMPVLAHDIEETERSAVGTN
jgi:hypothetical protein